MRSRHFFSWPLFCSSALKILLSRLVLPSHLLTHITLILVLYWRICVLELPPVSSKLDLLIIKFKYIYRDCYLNSGWSVQKSTAKKKKVKGLSNENHLEEEFKKCPHSFVFNRGPVGQNVQELISDMRQVMEPFTARSLKVKVILRQTDRPVKFAITWRILFSTKSVEV